MSRAVIPAMFLWDEPAAHLWQAAADDAGNDGHGEAFSDLPPHGDKPSVRYWLCERRERFLHEAQVRG